MKYRIIKYTLLIISALLTLSQVFPLNVILNKDYCFGIDNAIFTIFFIGLFLFVFLIFLIIDIIFIIKKKRDFDNGNLIIFGAFILLFVFFIMINRGEFRKNTIIEGRLEVGFLTDEQLVLNKDNTFLVILPGVAYSCTYFGSYVINNDTLMLQREELPIITNGLFATKYLICKSDSLLIPFDNSFEKIRITKMD